MCYKYNKPIMLHVTKQLILHITDKANNAKNPSANTNYQA